MSGDDQVDNSKGAAQGGIRAVKKLAAEAVVEDQTTKE